MQTSTSPVLKGSDYVLIPDRGIYVAKETSLCGIGFIATHRDAQEMNGRMPTIPEGVEFRRLMLSEREVYDGNGKIISSAEKKMIYEENTVAGGLWREWPWREWLDARFEQIGDVMVVHYNHRFIKDKLKALNTEPLEDCLMEDRLPGLSLEGYLQNQTWQGLPKKDVGSGSMRYSHPRYGAVAVFGVDSVCGAVLYCNWSPLGANPCLGVRLVVSAQGANFEK